jgi:hypothetical protein
MLILSRRSAAQSTRTAPRVLARLARSGDADIVDLVARNPRTPTEALSSLSASSAARVREAVASNPSSSEEILTHLALDPSPAVRLAVAGNRAAPSRALDTILSQSGNSEQHRIAIAGNEATSPKTLERLAASGTKAVKRAVASNRATPISARAELARIPELSAVIRATGYFVSPSARASEAGRWGLHEVRKLLATDPDDDVRRAVAAADDVVTETLALLANDMSSSVAEVAVAALTPDPAVITRLADSRDVLVLANLLRNTATPPEVRARLATRLLPVAGVATLKRIARDPATPADVLGRLADHAEPAVRGFTARNPVTPSSARKRLAGDGVADIRAAVAISPDLPADVLIRLACETAPSVRKAVAANPSTPPAMLTRLAADDVTAVRAAVASNLSSPAEALLRIVEIGSTNQENWSLEKDPLVVIAANPLAPPDALRRLAVVAGEVRSKVAANPSTPSDALEELASELLRDKSDSESRESTLLSIATNPATPLTTVHRLHDAEWVATRMRQTSYREDGRTFWDEEPDAIATRAARQYLSERIAGAISRKTWRVGLTYVEKLALAQERGTDHAILAELSSDEETAIRCAVAANPGTTHAHFLRLCADPIVDVRLAAAGARHSDDHHSEPSVFTEAFELLACDPVPSVRAAVVANGGVFWALCSGQTHKRVAYDPDPFVRAAFLGSYIDDSRYDTLPIPVLKHLVDRGDVQVWRALARDYKTPRPILDRLGRCNDVETRIAVASHPNAGGDLLELLASSADVEILVAIDQRYKRNARTTLALARNLNTPPETLRRLAQFPTNDEVLRVAAVNPATPPEVLIGFAEGTDERRMRVAAASKVIQVLTLLAANPAVSEDIIRRLADVDDGRVRAKLLLNPRTPADVLARLITEVQ